MARRSARRFMASSGVGKTRMTRDATLKASHKWRLLILSSGEQPFESKLVEDTRHGKRAFAGQLVRAIDIQANRGAAGVFDHYPDFDSKAFTDEMKRAASRFHGTAGPEFVRRLIEHGMVATLCAQRSALLSGSRLPMRRTTTGRRGERQGPVLSRGSWRLPLREPRPARRRTLLRTVRPKDPQPGRVPPRQGSETALAHPPPGVARRGVPGLQPHRSSQDFTRFRDVGTRRKWRASG